MCTSPMASSLGVDGERGRSGVAGSPMRTSAQAWEAWNSFHFLSRFLSPGDLRNLHSCPGLRNSFSIASQVETLVLWPDLYSLSLTVIVPVRAQPFSGPGVQPPYSPPFLVEEVSVTFHLQPIFKGLQAVGPHVLPQLKVVGETARTLGVGVAVMLVLY